MTKFCLLFSLSVITLFSCKKGTGGDGSIINIVKDSTSSLVVLKESDYRPVYHFTPSQKWMNDPNGLVYYKGKYHLFYQYNPNSSVWGPMHWGHAISTDLFNWQDQDIALSPDNSGTIFSGSAVVDVNNTAGFKTGLEDPLVAIYTLAGSQQHQSIAFSNDGGLNWSKYASNPVLPNPGVPDFRDPKVFWHPGKQKWMMTLAVGNKVSFYSSADLKSWNFESSFGENVGAHGGVWECPDLFELPVEGTNASKWVLLVSINPGGPNGGSATQYFVGNFDGKTFTTTSNETQWLDYGTDNYAGVTYNNIPAGKRIAIGWMSNWNYAQDIPTTTWRSTMTVPRELTLATKSQGFILKSNPVEELTKYTIGSPDTSILNSTKSIALLDNRIVKTGSYEVNFSTDLNVSTKTIFSIGNIYEKLLITFDKANQQIIIDRGASGKVDFNNNFKQKISCPFTPKTDGITNGHLLIDKTSVEVFVNGGESVATVLFFPVYQYNYLKISGDGTAESISKFKISGISKSLMR